MKPDQYNRAKEIVDQLKILYAYRDELKGVEGSKLASYEVNSYRTNDGSYPRFRVTDGSKMEHVPESVQVMMQASIMTIRASFEREIEKLEKEFEEL